MRRRGVLLGFALALYEATLICTSPLIILYGGIDGENREGERQYARNINVVF